MFSWSTMQLTEYFAAVSAPQEEPPAISAAVERAAETLEAQMGAVIINGDVCGSVGFDQEADPTVLVRAARGIESMTVEGYGTMHTMASNLGRGTPGALVVARTGAPFRQDERQIIKAMAQALGLALRSIRTLAAERTLRAEREREAEERLQLLDALSMRQRMLETLLGIQRSITNRKPLQEVLDTITTGAAGLLNSAVVTLVLADPQADDQLIAAWTCGPGDSLHDDALVMSTASDAMAANCVVTSNSRGEHSDRRCVIAAPVHVSGDVRGSLAAYTLGGGEHVLEQRELLAAFAQQISLAMTDANTVEAMREAYHDSLTGLPNRALFLDRLNHAIATNDGHVTALFIDLDRFKAVNDSLGHKAGDDLLAAVAGRIRSCVRTGDTASRLGGDEFAILLKGAGPRTGVRVARDIIAAVKEPFRIHGRDVYIAASVGVASGRGSGTDAGDLLSNADVAMYRAKKAGPGHIVIFEPHMHAEVVERLHLQADLQRALTLDEFRLQFQPLVHLGDNAPIGVESLLRWTHPERGIVPPSLSIPVAEETGLIVELGRWVLRESCRQAAEWRTTIPNMSINVNVSARQIMDAGFVSDVANAISFAKLPGESLTLELTETVLINDPDKALEQLHALKELGVRLSIDDFGTGYSSLSYLRQFPVDQLKIDRTFVAGLHSDAEDLAVVRTVVELGRTLRLETVAEGIEDRDQFQVLRQLGCDLGQGYHLAPPLDPEAVPVHFRRCERLTPAA
ncbi:MAG: EAL domain-containing protein [Dactylosporangium sp.]|nr:EAL domain-containing protein [Dactylosporangium sp.]NNJ61660.1 EAL domain-containing protein [Dactylosporangium sp.]